MRESSHSAAALPLAEPRPTFGFEEHPFGAEMGELLRSRDWAHTPLGPIERWPTALKGYLAMILELPTPAIIFWGPEQTQLYNRGYAVIMGPRHPKYFAAPYRECWPETYPLIIPLMQRVLAGEVVQVEDELFTLTRHGFAEECYFTFSFSPLRDDNGAIAGIYQPVQEVTQSVLRRRRARTLRALDSTTLDATREAFQALASDPRDLSFAALFRREAGGGPLALAGQCGLPEGAQGLEGLAAIAERVHGSGVPATVAGDEVVRALGHRNGWGDRTEAVRVVPVRRTGTDTAHGVLVLGLSTRLVFDDPYAEFCDALAGQLAARLAEEQAARTEKRLLALEHTARVQAEAARNRLTTLFENAPAFVASLRGPDHVFEMVNPRYQRMLGEGRLLLGRPVRQAVPEVVGQGFTELLDAVLSSGEPFLGREVRLRLDPTGEGTLQEVFLNFVYQPRRDHDGAVEGIDVFGFEVTEEVRARQVVEALADKLRASEQNFRVLLESIPQQVWTGTVDGAIDFVNSQVLGYFGVPLARVLGAAWLSFVHPDDREETARRWGHSVRTGEPYETEFRLCRADGVHRWHLARAQAVRGEQGAILRWFGTNTDIDETKKIRQDLKRRTDFEQYLVGIVSHDLRNPLNAILLSSGTLVRSPGLDEAAQKAVSRIQSSTRRATKMISDLLDFTVTRLGGTIPVVRTAVEVRDLVRAVIDEVEAAHPGRRISVTHQGATRGEWDGGRMAQVVLNLVSNALKYSPPESEVRLETRGSDERLTLAVHNQGTPIAPEKLAHIFEPLQRATLAIDPSMRSVGLGLYIVRQIVEAHGGSVEVASTEEQTSFVIHLPRTAPAA